MRNALATVGHMAVAAAVATAISVVALVAIAQVHVWPKFPSSNVLYALTTATQVACLAGLVAAGWLWRRGRRPLADGAALVSLSVFSVATLAIPLAATRLYLFGISIDQQFRTEYLTRLTDTAALRDMTYADLPPFYPPGWFWVGGRAAALTGIPAWEMYKPWAITSMTIAIALAFVLWTRMVRFEYALIVTTATAATTLAYSSHEPYAAVITVMLPPVLVLAWSGLRGGSRPQAGGAGSGGWAAVIGVGVFLGISALLYTLVFAYTAFTVAVMAVVAVVARWRDARRFDPLLRFAAIAVIAGAIALIGWLPYLLAVIGGSPNNPGMAQRYLPVDGARMSFPMLHFTLLGALCLLGTLWLVFRARSSTRAGALAIGVLAVYAWSLLSMLATLERSTLLSFRLNPTLTVLLAAAGGFAFVEAALALARRYEPATGRRVIVGAGVVGLIGAVSFSQDIPQVLRPDIVVAYTDTDGNAQRADQRPPGAEKYYQQIDAKILEVTGKPRNATVVMTADYSFLAYYPYWGFQSLTPHYANPLAEFDQRAAAIRSWSMLGSADQFVAALDALPWRAPTVFLMRRGADQTYTLRLAADSYPNEANIRRYQVALDSALFADPRFRVTSIGPFVLAIRTPEKTR